MKKRRGYRERKPIVKLMYLERKLTFSKNFKAKGFRDIFSLG